MSPAPAWTLPPEQGQRLIFAAGARNLASVAGPAGTLLVLEDLQWTGADALDLLATLVRAPEETPVRVLGAYRSTEVQPQDPAGRVAHRSRAGAPDRAGAAASWGAKEAAALLRDVLAGVGEGAASN